MEPQVPSRTFSQSLILLTLGLEHVLKGPMPCGYAKSISKMMGPKSVLFKAAQCTTKKSKRHEALLPYRRHCQEGEDTEGNASGNRMDQMWHPKAAPCRANTTSMLSKVPTLGMH
jgi:hypothetical protein